MFNNNFAPYNQPFAPQFQQNYQQNFQQDDRIFVANAAAADAYLIAPNSFVRLWDSSRPLFYEKQTDASGRQLPIAVYEYKRFEPVQQPTTDYESRIKAIEEKLAALEKGGIPNE